MEKQMSGNNTNQVSQSHEFRMKNIHIILPVYGSPIDVQAFGWLYS